MLISVRLRDIVTGYAASYTTDGWLDDEGRFSDFIWDEGNYSCDHNRILFLTLWGERGPNGLREHGDLDGDSIFNCQSERIIIDRIVDMGGNLLYSEPQNMHATRHERVSAGP